MMKKIFYCLPIIVLLLFSCAKEDEGVFVRFENVTKQKFENIEIFDNNYGDLEASETSIYFEFSSFGTDSGWPDMPFNTTVNGEQYESACKYYFCGTEKSTLENGYYTVTVTLDNSSNENLVHLKFKD